MPAARRRRDAQPTAEDLQQRGEGGDEALTIDWQTVGGTTPGRPDALLPDDVADRQAEAVADSAPVAGAGAPTAADAEKLKSDSYTYEEAKADMARLGELDTEQQKINRERSSIYSRMEKRGTNKAVFRSLVALGKKSAATIQAEEEERQKLFGWMIAPKIAEAADAGSEG